MTHSWPSADPARCTVPAAVEDMAARRPDALFLRDGTVPSSLREYTFGDVRRSMETLAAVLAEQGVGAGDTVAILAPNGAFLLFAMLAVQRAGAVSLIYYPPSGSGLGQYRENLLEQLGRSNTRGLIVGAEYGDAELVPRAGEVSGLRFVLREAAFHASVTTSVLPPTPRDPKAVAHLQYTSGSTGRQRGVVVTHQGLVDNVDCIRRALGLSEADRLVTWLPLAHDLGLIGAVLLPLLTGIPIWLMRPSQFVLRPLHWIQALSEFRATVTFAPNFAFQRCVAAVPADTPQVDLSHLRLAVCAAEPIVRSTLDAFQERFRRHGLRDEVLCPAYGLAENTVGVTSRVPGTGARFEDLDYQSLTGEGLAEVARPGRPSVAVCSVGKALAGVDVSIVDEQGREVPERVVGEIVVRGRSVAKGYRNDPLASSHVFRDSGLHTGDCGYFAEGELFITGRKKELIIHAGRNYYPQDIEASVSGIDGVLQAVAFGVFSESKATEVIVLMIGTKTNDPRRREELAAACRVAVRDQLDVGVEDVAFVGRHLIPKTTSGKVRRAECRSMYQRMTNGVADDERAHRTNIA